MHVHRRLARRTLRSATVESGGLERGLRAWARRSTARGWREERNPWAASEACDEDVETVFVGKQCVVYRRLQEIREVIDANIRVRR